MRKLLSILLCLSPFLVVEGAILAARAIQPAPMGTCSGTTPCYACKNCSACVNCHVRGGACGVCLAK